MYTLAIDIGGTKVTLGVFRDEQMVERHSVKTDRSGGPGWVVEQIEKTATPWLSRYSMDGCGIGFGGPVDFYSQRVICSTHVAGWTDFDLVGVVRERLGVTAVMDRDTMVGALGEGWYGAGRGARPLFYMTLSTGIGGGLLTESGLYHGADSFSCEIGHVEKEELMRKVWPDTFVEENNLAFHISVLRKLFEENSASPRYIETISKRGYRFIADVIQISVNGAGEIETIEPPPAPPPAVPVKRRFVRLQAFLIALATLALLAIVLSRAPRAAKLSDSDVIVLADFVNKTGDPVFDGTLQQGLAVQLKQSPFLSLLSESRVRHLIQLMGQPADARLTSELARDICERTASAAVLEGSIARLGNHYVLGLRAKNCSSGEMLDDEQVQAARKEDVLNALSQMARNFRSRAGESLVTIRSHDTPLAEATTPSLEALKAYSSAWKILAARGATAALPLFRRAAQLDSEFAMAHASLGRMYATSISPIYPCRAWSEPGSSGAVPAIARNFSSRKL